MSGANTGSSTHGATGAAERGAVIIAIYNRASDAIECIESLQQCLPPNIEIVLVDNGSAEDLRPQFEQRFPQVHTKRLEPNRGWPAAVNFGARFAMARGATRLYFLNDDTIVQPGFWENCARAMDEHGADVVASVPVYYGNPDTIQTAGVTIDLNRMEIHHRGADCRYDANYGNFHACDAIVGTGVMIRSSTFRELRGFEERFQFYYEDFDFCLRAARHGYTVGVAGDSIIQHRTSRTIGRLSRNYFYYLFRNKLWCAQRHMPRRTYWLRLPHMLARDFVRLARQIPEIRRRPQVWWALLSGARDGVFSTPKRWVVLPEMDEQRGAEEWVKATTTTAAAPTQEPVSR